MIGTDIERICLYEVFNCIKSKDYIKISTSFDFYKDTDILFKTEIKQMMIYD